MTLLEALQTNKRFKRPTHDSFIFKGETNALHYLNSGYALSIGVEGIQADDWYAECSANTISIKELNDAFVNARIDKQTICDIVKELDL